MIESVGLAEKLKILLMDFIGPERIGVQFHHRIHMNVKTVLSKE